MTAWLCISRLNEQRKYWIGNFCLRHNGNSTPTPTHNAHNAVCLLIKCGRFLLQSTEIEILFESLCLSVGKKAVLLQDICNGLCLFTQLIRFSWFSISPNQWCAAILHVLWGGGAFQSASDWTEIYVVQGESSVFSWKRQTGYFKAYICK